MEINTVESIPITIRREEDGRWWADIESMPGVMAYGQNRDAAISAVRAVGGFVADRMGDRLAKGFACPTKALRLAPLHFRVP